MIAEGSPNSRAIRRHASARSTATRSWLSPSRARQSECSSILDQRPYGRKEEARHPLIDRLHSLTFIFGVERLKLHGGPSDRAPSRRSNGGFLAIRHVFTPRNRERSWLNDLARRISLPIASARLNSTRTMSQASAVHRVGRCST